MFDLKNFLKPTKMKIFLFLLLVLVYSIFILWSNFEVDKNVKKLEINQTCTELKEKFGYPINDVYIDGAPDCLETIKYEQLKSEKKGVISSIINLPILLVIFTIACILIKILEEYEKRSKK